MSSGTRRSELARYITSLLDSGGEQTAAAGDRRHEAQPDPRVFAWVSSEAAARTQELSYEDLAVIRG
ncbi:hypothetical protein ACFZC6_42035 [Streptomyces ossamyceticus]|uniref:hypothetical protein n=1 Tax=Streptomyces ossamyceticus TaxID=249581 RepID=UPI0036EFFB06